MLGRHTNNIVKQHNSPCTDWINKGVEDTTAAKWHSKFKLCIMKKCENKKVTITQSKNIYKWSIMSKQKDTATD